MADTKQTFSAPVIRKGRKGFLPFTTNTFDRVMISIYLYIAIHLLWMRLLEPLGLPLWLATMLSLFFAVLIVRKG